jgi:hypothetical protein
MKLPRKTIRHRWIKQNGFRIHKCERCGCVREWKNDWGGLTYSKPGYMWLYAPSCVLPNTKIN